MKPSTSERADSASKAKSSDETWAHRLGRAVQAAVLAALVVAVVLRLLQIEESLVFRYGGF